MTAKEYRFTGWFIHLFVWAIIFGIPMFMFGPNRPIISGRDWFGFFIMPISFACVFYVNYCFLIGHYLFRQRIWTFLLNNVILIAAVIFFVHILSKCMMPQMPPDVHDRPEPPPVNAIVTFIGRNALLYIFVTGVSVAIKMTSSWFRTEAERKELEHSKTQAELQNLKSQINPHFLFNTLNNIYSLIQFDSDRAQQSVLDLSRMLRYVLYDSSMTHVPLDSEVTFLNDYIQLMRLRLPKDMKVSVSMPESRPTVKIAPLLFISLVENAFKHGVSNDNPCFIDIELTEDNGVVKFRSRNSSFRRTTSDNSGSGIGLTNLAKRLELAYPGKHEFRHAEKDGIYETLLSIDTRPTINDGKT